MHTQQSTKTRTFHITVTVTEGPPLHESQPEPTPEAPPAVISQRAKQHMEDTDRAQRYASEVLGQ